MEDFAFDEQGKSGAGEETVSCIFIGNTLAFSDISLRLVEGELPCISCYRTPAVNDLLLMGPERSANIRLVIVDEALGEDLTKVMAELRSALPLAVFALAYRNREHASLWMRRTQSNPQWGKISFLPMNVSVDCWLSVVRLLSWGEQYIPPQLFGTPAEPEPVQQAASELPVETAEPDVECQLTARERQVLESAAAGKQNKTIADELNLSQHTVKLHMHHIIAKLGVHNRTEAANWFHGRYPSG